MTEQRHKIHKLTIATVNLVRQGDEAAIKTMQEWAADDVALGSTSEETVAKVAAVERAAFLARIEDLKTEDLTTLQEVQRDLVDRIVSSVADETDKVDDVVVDRFTNLIGRLTNAAQRYLPCATTKVLRGFGLQQYDRGRSGKLFPSTMSWSTTLRERNDGKTATTDDVDSDFKLVMISGEDAAAFREKGLSLEGVSPYLHTGIAYLSATASFSELKIDEGARSVVVTFHYIIDPTVEGDELELEDLDDGDDIDGGFEVGEIEDIDDDDDDDDLLSAVRTVREELDRQVKSIEAKRSAKAMAAEVVKNPKEDAPPLSDRAAELRKKAQQRLEEAIKLMNEQLKAGDLNEADTAILTNSANRAAEIAKDWRKEEQDESKRKASEALRGAEKALKEWGGDRADPAVKTLRGLADLLEIDSAAVNKELALSGLELAESLLEEVAAKQNDE